VTGIHPPLLALAIVVLSGCVSVPDADRLVVSERTGVTTFKNAACGAPAPLLAGTQGQPGELNPTDIRLMTWNVHKARNAGWTADFLRLGTSADIFVLQEAHLTEPFTTTLDKSGFHWSMAHAFTYAGGVTGVLTASRTPASGACLTREVEPLLRLPKSALITRYSIEGSGDALLMANVHGINFSLGTARFRRQLEDVVSAVRSHEGPLILAGDFNDWSERRSEILKSLTTELRLKRLELSPDGRSRHLGKPVDHVFYRELDVVDARAVEVTSSDHNPVLVRFRVPKRNEERQQ
jgi:endonuclease/exonuclease/phosphatase (EEP) superfamily protein YafD